MRLEINVLFIKCTQMIVLTKIITLNNYNFKVFFCSNANEYDDVDL